MPNMPLSLKFHCVWETSQQTVYILATTISYQNIKKPASVRQQATMKVVATHPQETNCKQSH